jgi:putative transposase
MQTNLFNNPVHITNRAQNRERFQIPTKEAWEISCNFLRSVSHAYAINVHLFLMMDNHIHLIASAPENNLSQAMRYFFSETSRTMNKASNKINHTWGAQHRPTKINDYNHYVNAYKYGYQNPVEAKIVERVEDYPYSSLRGLIGYEPCILTIQDDLLFSNGLQRHLEWLNTPPKASDWESVRRALRRKVFTLPKIDSRPNGLEARFL